MKHISELPPMVRDGVGKQSSDASVIKGFREEFGLDKEWKDWPINNVWFVHTFEAGYLAAYAQMPGPSGSGEHWAIYDLLDGKGIFDQIAPYHVEAHNATFWVVPAAFNLVLISLPEKCGAMVMDQRDDTGWWAVQVCDLTESAIVIDPRILLQSVVRTWAETPQGKAGIEIADSLNQIKRSEAEIRKLGQEITRLQNARHDEQMMVWAMRGKIDRLKAI